MESAVSLTKALRWDIQSLGVRLAKAASAEEASRRAKSTSQSRAAHELELRLIVIDIKKLLTRIEDAVPLINLAITTSGARLTTTLPGTVSPSRLLQASTFLTAGDTQYSIDPEVSVQVGPTFVLSLYMLFSGHTNRISDDPETARNMTWKEAIHKARVKIMRTPINTALEQAEEGLKQESILSARSEANEFAYQIDITEDLDDDRVHSFEDDEPQPGPYDDVALAGIRENLPIYQISKIFYADTGKILDLGSQSETNNPVLLLKRDTNALPPRRMMQEGEQENMGYEDFDESVSNTASVHGPEAEEGEDEERELERQIRRESSVPASRNVSEPPQKPAPDDKRWCLPPNLDPEWMALEVYTESEDSSSEDEADPNNDSAYVSHRPSSSDQEPQEASITTKLSNLKINQSPSPGPNRRSPQQVSSPSPLHISPNKASPFGPIRSSLSLLEMLIRLTALQQFQQASHLSIPDELLTFFLEESSTTGAGGDGEQRRVTRREARRKVGFDPYDESPIKRRGEDYQYQQQENGPDGYAGYSRGGTPYEDLDQRSEYASPYPRQYTPQGQRTSELWPSERQTSSGSESRSRGGTPDMIPSSPMSPYKPNPNRQQNRNKLLGRVQQVKGTGVKLGSPLGRGVSVETDSSLGTSPGSPTLVARREEV